MKNPAFFAAALAAFGAPALVCAQEPGAATPEQAAAPATTARVAAGTLVDLEILQDVSSATNRIGDRFPIRVINPVIVDGAVVIPAGATGVAEVTTASPAGMMAKGGELMVLARYLEVDGRQIPLRGLKLGVRGENNLFVAFVAAQAVGPLALFIKGGNVVFPAGTQAQAKIAADTLLTRLADAPAASPDLPAAPVAEANVVPAS